MKKTGEVIRDKRKSLGISLRDMARQLDIAPSYLSDIENNRRIPSEKVILNLSDKTGIPFDSLMSIAGKMGDETDIYIKSHPSVVGLIRTIASLNLEDSQIDDIILHVESTLKTGDGQ